MRMFRFAVVLMVLALIAAIVPATLAQDTSLGLSEGDATLLETAITNSSQYSQLSFDYTGDFNITGIPDSSDVSVSFTGSGAVNGEAEAFELTISGQATAEGQTSPFELELRVIGDMFYINLGPAFGGWLGGNVNEMMDLSSAMGGDLLPVDPSTLQDPEAMNEAMGQLMEMPGMMEGLTALSTLDPADFISQSRADAAGLAEFSTTLSFGDLMATSEMQQFMTAMAQAAASQDSSSMEGFDPAMLPMIAQLLSDSTLTVVQKVDPATELIAGAGLNLAMNLDPAVIGETGTPIVVGLTTDIDISGYGEAVDIVAPESYQDIAEMMNAMSS
ncbi:MAG: hypothetical protein KJ065_14750 [Anaerolineae bacterium]|nr:hypothetical protein [Anaerolineae bacterium]